jgi:uncharacterized protein
VSRPRLAGLWVHPLKSARPVRLEEAVVEQRGLHGDRRWMLVDANGVFVSQRSTPRLASLMATTNTAGDLTLSADGLSSLMIPLPTDSASKIPVSIWTDTVTASTGPANADSALSDWLGLPVRLVRLNDQSVRPTEMAGEVQVSLADGFPYLLSSVSSLADLNARLETPIGMERFRPNLVIEGTDPWAEDEWTTLMIGDVEFENIKPCARCVVTTTDQVSGERRGAEPLATLATFRRDAAGKVLFGVNLVARNEGVIRVGDSLILQD